MHTYLYDNCDLLCFLFFLFLILCRCTVLQTEVRLVCSHLKGCSLFVWGAGNGWAAGITVRRGVRLHSAPLLDRVHVSDKVVFLLVVVYARELACARSIICVDARKQIFTRTCMSAWLTLWHLSCLFSAVISLLSYGLSRASLCLLIYARTTSHNPLSGTRTCKHVAS